MSSPEVLMGNIVWGKDLVLMMHLPAAEPS